VAPGRQAAVNGVRRRSSSSAAISSSCHGRVRSCLLSRSMTLCCIVPLPGKPQHRECRSLNLLQHQWRICWLLHWRRRSSGCLRTQRPRDRSSSSSMDKIFLLSTPSRPALGPTQWLPGATSLGIKLTTRLQLTPKSRIRGSIHPLLHKSSRRMAWLVKHRNNFAVVFTAFVFSFVVLT
jgi:hypothetical protein